MKTPVIGIDLMGSDTPPPILLQAVIELTKQLDGRAKLTLFGSSELLGSAPLPPSLTPVVAEEVITMEDDPLVAVRRKKNSSLSIAMLQLKKGALDALISAGNTGAIIASAKLNLPSLPGIARPALLALIPTKHRPLAVIDVGANISYKIDHLVQFAAMALAYQKTRGIDQPTLGLLNIGSEATKGTPELREVYRKLQKFNRPGEPATFLGNIEGKDVFKGEIDALITDGFTGNIFLKTAEGISSFLLGELEQMTRTSCPPAFQEMLHTWHERLYHSENPGAIVCGVDGIVVKCHGDVTPGTLVASVHGTIRLIENHFLDKIKQELAASSHL
jgi:phosphate acyltransferase